MGAISLQLSGIIPNRHCVCNSESSSRASCHTPSKVGCNRNYGPTSQPRTNIPKYCIIMNDVTMVFCLSLLLHDYVCIARTLLRPWLCQRLLICMCD